MSEPPPTETKSWLVGVRDSALSMATVRARLESDPSARIVRTMQLQGGTELMVVEMSEESMRRHDSEFGSQWHVELNRPLDPW